MSETHPGVDQESSVGMGQQRRHFRVAPVSRARSQKEDLHLQFKSRAGQKPWQQTARQTLERGVEHLQTSDRSIPREKTGGEGEDSPEASGSELKC